MSARTLATIAWSVIWAVIITMLIVTTVQANRSTDRCESAGGLSFNDGKACVFGDNLRVTRP